MKGGFYSRAEIAGIVQRTRNPNPVFAAGRVFFVDHVNGSNGYGGDDPERPLKTIAHALTLCVADRNDYIIVMNVPWGVHETAPIAIEKRGVHIIGLCRYGVPISSLYAGDDNEPIFTLNSSVPVGGGDHVEIAGLDLGGGTAHAAIEPVLGCVDLLFIHHCQFGSEWCFGDTPLHGVLLPKVIGAKAWRIEECRFFGASDGGSGKIIDDGVHIDEGRKHEVKDCVFMGLPGVAIEGGDGDGLIIRGNEIALDTNQQGAGITMGAGSLRSLISYNKAAWGDTDGGAANPYLENGDNAWVANYVCEVCTAPA